MQPQPRKVGKVRGSYGLTQWASGVLPPQTCCMLLHEEQAAPSGPQPFPSLLSRSSVWLAAHPLGLDSSPFSPQGQGVGRGKMTWSDWCLWAEVRPGLGGRGHGHAGRGAHSPGACIITPAMGKLLTCLPSASWAPVNGPCGPATPALLLGLVMDLGLRSLCPPSSLGLWFCFSLVEQYCCGWAGGHAIENMLDLTARVEVGVVGPGGP